MTPEERQQVMDTLRSNSPLARLRAAFSVECARIELAASQSRPPDPVEMRKMELDAARRLAKEMGIDL